MPSDPNTGSNIVNQYIDYCKQLSVESTEHSSVIKLICSNLRSTDKKELFKIVFKDVEDDACFLDWGKVPLVSRMASNASFWLHIFDRYLDFPETKNTKFDSLLVSTLEKNLSDSHINLEWPDVARILLLMNVDCIQGLYSVNLFLNSRFSSNMNTQCMKLMSLMADSRFTFEDHANTMHWVLMKCCIPSTDTLRADVHRAFAKLQVTREAMAVKTVHSALGRPRLRDRLTGIKMADRNSCMHTNSFEWFKTMASFSSMVSYNTQMKAYFVMAQNAVDVKAVTASYFSLHVVDAVSDLAVESPEIAMLHEVISRVVYTKQPFKQLVQFHADCFGSIASSHKNKLTLTQVMQLYLTIYQKKSIWQDCWLLIAPFMNTQLVRDVDTFRAKYPTMCEADVVYAISSFT